MLNLLILCFLCCKFNCLNMKYNICIQINKLKSQKTRQNSFPALHMPPENSKQTRGGKVQRKYFPLNQQRLHAAHSNFKGCSLVRSRARNSLSQIKQQELFTAQCTRRAHCALRLGSGSRFQGLISSQVRRQRAQKGATRHKTHQTSEQENCRARTGAQVVGRDFERRNCQPARPWNPQPQAHNQPPSYPVLSPIVYSATIVPYNRFTLWRNAPRER